MKRGCRGGGAAAGISVSGDSICHLGLDLLGHRLSGLSTDVAQR